MENNSALDYLLKVEAEASAIVNETQEEADRRIRENEEKNRAVFDEQYKARFLKHQSDFKKAAEEIKIKYQTALDEYRVEISQIKADTREFANLLEEYLFEKDE